MKKFIILALLGAVGVFTYRFWSQHSVEKAIEVSTITQGKWEDYSLVLHQFSKPIHIGPKAATSTANDVPILKNVIRIHNPFQFSYDEYLKLATKSGRKSFSEEDFVKYRDVYCTENPDLVNVSVDYAVEVTPESSSTQYLIVAWRPGHQNQLRNLEESHLLSFFVYEDQEYRGGESSFPELERLLEQVPVDKLSSFLKVVGL